MTQTIEATEDTWHSIVKGDGLTLVDFWAPWCGWCRKLAPIFEELASAYAGRVRLVKVNMDEELSIAQRYGVQSLPTLVFLHDGELVGQILGLLAEAHCGRRSTGSSRRARRAQSPRRPGHRRLVDKTGSGIPTTHALSA